MYRPIFTVFLFVWTTCCLIAQTKYEEGYFISNDGKKTSCLVKNKDWESPSEIEWKLTKNGVVNKRSVADIQELGILDILKFKKYAVEIDRSRKYVDRLSESKDTDFEKEELLLKSIVEGKFSLFSYEENDVVWYFFRVDNQAIEQLIYKKYRVGDGPVKVNETYKQQLWEKLKCEGITILDLNDLEYGKKRLANFFLKNNECHSAAIENYFAKEKKDWVKFYLRPGISRSNYSVRDLLVERSIRDLDFRNKIGLRVGLEAEFTLLHKNNKWSFVVEPTLQYLQAKTKQTRQFANEPDRIDYKSLEVPLGIRRYFFLGEQFKVYVNGFLVIDLPISSTVDYDDGKSLDIKFHHNWSAGIGLSYQDKFQLEIRHGFNRELLYSTENFSDLDYTTLIIGFGIQ